MKVPCASEIAREPEGPEIDRQISVLLMAYGSPRSPEEVPSYLTHIRGGRSPTGDEVRELEQRYAKIGWSPLLEITTAQAQALEQALNADKVAARVYIGMKHAHPFVEETVKLMVRDEVSFVVGIPMAPHYSRMGVGSYREALEKAQKKLNVAFKVSFVERWYHHPLFVDAWVERIEEALSSIQQSDRRNLVLVFTAHSLPERILEFNDPYPRELQETCKAIVNRMNVSDWSFAYQSASHTGQKWLGPDIIDKLSELRDSGYRNVLIAPIGFVADHLEILYDIDVKCQTWAKNNGMVLKRTRSLDTSPKLIACLASIVRERVAKDHDLHLDTP